jgi:hypothetical protein
MIKSFFQHLEENDVRWLLVSGQATILYGAATFSEDIDIWAEPSAGNLENLKAALHESRAQYYKLTPPLTSEYALRHHGFHFVLPFGVDVYLDVMGRPPRVGSFDAAWDEAQHLSTEWGTLPTLGIQQLVELKKTQRLRDYPIISRLALLWMDERGAERTPQDLAWATDNLFSLPEFVSLFRDHPGVADELLDDCHELVRRASREIAAHHQLSPELEDELEEWLDQRTAPLRRADRHFWRPVIDELRGLRAAGQLMAEGSAV